jgi:hypothetical protein
MFEALGCFMKFYLTYLHSCEFNPIYIFFCDVQTD